VDAVVPPDTEPAEESATAAVPPAPQLEYRAEPVRTVQPKSPPEEAAAVSTEASAPAVVSLPVAVHLSACATLFC